VREALTELEQRPWIRRQGHILWAQKGHTTDAATIKAKTSQRQ
jgi:hypothetical protein